jgi:3-hydroxymyristoyl/3-hydroxydecanoyl-(acyl carrier protein) dehydratase/malonyl CoA-acyl carrier protein transacylase
VPASLLGTRREVFFSFDGDNVPALIDALDRLDASAREKADAPLDATAHDWFLRNAPRPHAALAVVLVARNRRELAEQLDATRQFLRDHPDQSLPTGAGGPGLAAALRDRVFYSPRPLGRDGHVAFVFPGSGNDFAGMGRDLALWRPGVLRRQNAENQKLRSQLVADKYWTDERSALSVRERIFGQVTLGALVGDLLAEFGVRPASAIGYSLGESAALFALRAWTDRDAMFRSMHDSPLFATELTGPCNAARRAWKTPDSVPVEWTAGIVDRGPEDVLAALTGLERAYLLIVNTPRECVVGGDRAAIDQLVRRLGARLLALQNTTTVHCPVAREVADAYRELHRLPTTPPPGVRFYSAALGRQYELNQDSAAEAILAQALDTVDFPALIKAAYRDGARIFVETGPGASCSRMIDAILGDQPHVARSACVPGSDNVSTVLRLLAQLIAERVHVDWNALYPGETAGADDQERLAAGRQIVLQTGGSPFVIPERRDPTPSPIIPIAAPTRAQGAGKPRGTLPSLAPPTPLPGLQRQGESNSARAVTALTEGSIVSDSGAIAPVLSSLAAAEQARSQAHAAYLRLAQAAQRDLAESLAFQTTLLESLLASGQVIAPSVGAAPISPPPVSVVLGRKQCLEFAVGSIAKVLGPAFASVDSFPTRVRLPDAPLMLVDRITAIEGEPGSLGSGRVVTEHDVLADGWYLDGGRIPTSIAVEAGQADLFLSSYLGIDSQTRGLAVYRLLDAVVTFHRGLPPAGSVIRYDIRIERFFRQGDTYLFRFGFEGTVDGEPLLTMTDGCAGFFTAEALAAGKGIVHTALDVRPGRGGRPDDEMELPSPGVESYSSGKIEALRRGDAASCFGPAFSGIQLAEGLRLPTGRMRLVDRVTQLDPDGGRFGVGLIRAEMDIEPEAWFLTCHFVDDRVMPGTLMYECCLHTLRIFLLRRGWVASDRPIVTEPIPGVASRLKCRGQVTGATRTVTYEVTLKELGFRPEAYAIADALMYADGKPIVEITNLSLRLTGLDRETVRATWSEANSKRPGTARPVPFGTDRILAFAIGKPSDAFGEPYRIFDQGRVIARLPGPPYQFLDRITLIEAEPWRMVEGGVIEAEYDVPPDAWYFAADRQPAMPFAVLLEVALQPCGWLAAYIGSALTSPVDLSFRNLGGSAELLEEIGADAGTLTTRVKIARVSRSAGMIIQGYDFTVSRAGRPVYRGETTFGFFPKEALANQVGLRDEIAYQPDPAEQARTEAFDFPHSPPMPDERWRMIDRVDDLILDGGPRGLGFVRGQKAVNPEEWFFKAHFYQDPVIPGSLGLESLLQLLKALALRRWGAEKFVMMRGGRHAWLYRGQVIPTSRNVTVTAVVTRRDDAARQLTADGVLTVDGRAIYKMKDFTLGVASPLP